MAHRFHNERGVTYLFLMFAIVLIGLSTTVAAKQWKVMVQRELEADRRDLRVSGAARRGPIRDDDRVGRSCPAR